jgi:hypothetical protein
MTVMAGRGKKNDISPEDMARAEKLAYDGCQNGTIEGLMGWYEGFISKRDDIARILLRKRQERYAWLREKQFQQADKNPVSAIFLGKNYLGQADKQEITGKDGAALAAPMIVVQPPDCKDNSNKLCNSGDSEADVKQTPSITEQKQG